MNDAQATRFVEHAPLPWFARAVLVDARGVERALQRLRESGRFDVVPNSWQITLGVLRMWHRLVFRSEEIGTSVRPVRKSWRAKLFHPRPLRFPFLVAERAIAPLDSSGLLSSRERVLRHLLGAHHEGAQFAYDLQMLFAHPGALEELVERTRSVLNGTDPRAKYLRDLTVFEGYHEDLLAASEAASQGDLRLSQSEASDPDICFGAYLAWCASQPATYAQTLSAWRAGRYTIADGLQ